MSSEEAIALAEKLKTLNTYDIAEELIRLHHQAYSKGLDFLETLIVKK